jgi:hypothetical protein
MNIGTFYLLITALVERKFINNWDWLPLAFLVFLSGGFDLDPFYSRATFIFRQSHPPAAAYKGASYGSMRLPVAETALQRVSIGECEEARPFSNL